MHKSAKRVNIGRNSETVNPIGPHFIARSSKKKTVNTEISVPESVRDQR
jgi:hypothetical protein